MGWLGWPPDVAMAADVNLIRMAINGRRDLLAVMGLVKLPEAAGQPMTTGDWQAFKKRHNVRYQVQRRRRDRGQG